jgi:hypothetical protein
MNYKKLLTACFLLSSTQLAFSYDAVLAYKGATGDMVPLAPYSYYNTNNLVLVGTNVTPLGNFTYLQSGSFIPSQTNTQANLQNYFDLTVSSNKFTCTNPNGRWYTITMQVFWGGVYPSTPMPNRTLLISPVGNGTTNQTAKTGAYGASTVNYESTIGSGQSLSTRIFVPYNQSFFLEGICDKPRYISMMTVFIQD